VKEVRIVATEHVDAVVVGSGFGGSVSAYRLAEAGRSVMLLERGRPYPPGSFPRTPQEMGRSFWDPSEGRYGLFDVWRFRGFDSLVSAGLGGGSLIYANVMLRKDEKWFVKDEPMPGGGYERWPISRADLDPHYGAVEKMLGANPYPLHAAAYRDTPKTHAMVTAAEENGLDWQLPPLAISFAPVPGEQPAVGIPIVTPEYGNIHGVPRRTCRLVGECDIGCNDGAKNTLDHTYLSAAQHHGAQIRTCCEVRGISPLDSGGYEVTYTRHEDGTPDDGETPETITCEKLILGAGAYGTTYLLLRNRTALPGLSDALGTRYSGNGDLLTFLLPRGHVPRSTVFDGSHGPVITAAIRVPDAMDDGGTGRGFYIEDGGYPGFVDWLVESSDITGTMFRIGELMARWALGKLTRTASTRTRFNSEMSSLIGDGTLAAGSLPLLGMGRDIPDGVMKLCDDGTLGLEWTTDTSLAYFERVRETMRKLARALDVEYVDNPIWFFKRIITVHPVGGAPMGHNATEGVCDGFGEVYGHPGLYVADGAVMPGPVGTNPSLTIAAHADRMATRLLESWPAHRRGDRRGRTVAVRGATRTVPAPPSASATASSRIPSRTTLSFTEEMKGFFAFDESDPSSGDRIGRERDQALMFHLTITADDVNRFLGTPSHQARAEGWVEAPALSGRLAVQQGWFNLFVPGDSPRARRMDYRLYFADAEGHPLTLSGRKEVRDDSVLDIWPDTSTLYYRLLRGHVDAAAEASAAACGAGVAHIPIEDFIHQLTTFRTIGPGQAQALRGFGQFFLGQLWDVYGRHIGPANVGVGS
jgi:cholesterol oxidase